MTLFREVADIQTADMLNLPVPQAHYHNVALPPTAYQKKLVEGLSERAEQVRSGGVSPDQDNMLLITNDGRKLALERYLSEHPHIRYINLGLDNDAQGQKAAVEINASLADRYIAFTHPARQGLQRRAAGSPANPQP